MAGPPSSISLATYDRERVSKLTNYIQPQLIGGLRRRLETAERASTINLPTKGAAEVLVNVGEHSEITSTSVVAENPKEIGLGGFLIGAIKDAQFTPAYNDRKTSSRRDERDRELRRILICHGRGSVSRSASLSAVIAPLCRGVVSG